MERSQSYTHFETATTGMQQKSASGSNMNVNQLHTSVNKTYTLNQSTNSLSLRRKRKLLQRQPSHEYADDDMDYEYAADEEDADADEEEEDELDIDDVLLNSGDDSMSQTIMETQADQRSMLPNLTLKKYLPLISRRKPLMQAINYANNSIPQTATIFRNTTTTNSNCSALAERQRHLKHEDSFDSSSSTGVMSIGSPVSPHSQFHRLKRDNSIHSDSSRYSSVDSLLEARKPDPEAILLNLGFGPIGSEDVLSRIPKRFLKPSQVRGNDTEAFVRRLQLASSLADHSVLGYRGLTGNPDMPPSTIVAKIMRRFEVNERKKSLACIEHTIQ